MKISKTFPLFASIILGTVVNLPVFAQNAADGRFHDDLLDHLVGKWEIVAVAHGRPPDPGILEADWVMNHQYLRVHQKNQVNVPGINTPYEGDFFIGYDHPNKRYVAHLVNVFGGDEPTEGLLHGSRTGNEIKLVYKTVGDTTINQRFIWEPESKSWHIVIRAEVGGKEGEPFLDIKVTAATHLPIENK